jgi:pimeloyl-ACP methyl ester carboxylesterase
MKLLSTVAHAVDRVFARGVLNPPQAMRGHSAAERLAHADRLRALSVMAAFYNRPEHLTREGPFFPAPSPIAPHAVQERMLGNEGMVIDLTWTSEFTPLWSTDAVASLLGSWAPEQLERAGLAPTFHVDDITNIGVDASGSLVDKYLRVQPNRIAHARWFRHLDGAPRPVVVILHGYMAGEYLIEERMWPVQKLFARGADVVLSVLPFHGRRRSPRRGYLPPAFPSADARFTIEGMRQLVFDHRALFDYLERQGTPAFSVMGISLGGYGASLLSTVEERLRCGLFFIPLSAIELFAHTYGRFTGSHEEQLLQREAMRRANFPVSPLARPPVFRGAQAVIINGLGDAITGHSHTEPLRQHFDAEVHHFLGGHLLQLGRGRAFEAMWRMLAREGFLHR